MKQKLIKSLAVGLASIGMLFTYQSTAFATSQYSAKRSHEVKLIWRKSMGRHAFLAPTGARFSKHLGTRYGYNTETADVTWYTDAHEKLYLKNLNMYSIYYHVTNADQSLQGWIWKGYMKPAPVAADGASTSSNDNSSNTTNSDSSTATTKFDADSFNKQIIQLFPGLIEDTKLDQLASYCVWLDNHGLARDQTRFSGRLVKLYGGEPKGLLEEWDGVPRADINLVKNQVESPLNEIKYSNLSQYAGYHIGVASFLAPFTSSKDAHKIGYYIFTLPANPTINPSTYKPN